MRSRKNRDDRDTLVTRRYLLRKLFRYERRPGVMSLSLLAGKKSFEIKLGKDVNRMEFNHNLRPRQRNLKKHQFFSVQTQNHQV